MFRRREVIDAECQLVCFRWLIALFNDEYPITEVTVPNVSMICKQTEKF
jgi:hypothetical protein